jgi:predicted membrane-bound spermidine synthase
MTVSTPQPPRLLPACLFLVSFGVLALEITLARLAAVLLSNPYAFLVLALAMLGIGLGGAIGWFLERRVDHLSARALARRALAFALLVPATVLLVTAAGRSATPAWMVLIMAPIAGLPFAAAGVFMSGLYRFYPAAGHRLYALDLLGAAAGAWGAVLLLDGLGAVGAGVLAGAGGAAAALVLSLHPRPAAGPALLSSGALLLILGMGFVAPKVDRLQVPIGRNPDKEINEALQQFQGEVAATRWTAFGRTDLVRYPGRDQVMDLYLDGTAGSPLYRFDGRAADLDRVVRAEMADFPGSVPLHVQPPSARRTALVIGPGGGRDVLLALWAGFEQVTAVEVNPDVVALVRENGAFSGGIYDTHPQVEIVVDEGRHFLRSRRRSFDVIFLSLPVINTARSLEGYALTENFLFTVESMREYWDALTATGSLVVVVHNDAEALRLMVLSLRMLAQVGLDSAAGMRHLGLVGSEDYQCVVLRKPGFTPEESRVAARMARERGFPAQLCFFPFVAGVNPRLAELGSGRIGPDGLVREVRALGWDISPVSDNRPFFYKLDPGWSAPILYAAGATLLLLLTVTGAASVRPATGAGGPGVTAVFLLLGVGFMAMETGLLSHFYMIFGSPAVAMAAFLSALLLWAGLGSRAGGRWFAADPGKRLRHACTGLTAILLAYAAVLPWGTTRILMLGEGWRQAAAVLLLMPIGLCAGVPFPAAIARLKAAGQAGRIHWMYAVNGTASVAGSVLALLLATEVGYREVLAGAAACYMCAGLLARTACESGTDELRLKSPVVGPARQGTSRAALRRFRRKSTIFTPGERRRA